MPPLASDLEADAAVQAEGRGVLRFDSEAAQLEREVRRASGRGWHDLRVGAIDSVATAPTMPVSSAPRIDRDEIIELLEESLHRLPDELRQARWMLKERQEFVAKTRREADELLEVARVKAERMVQRTEVVRAAEQRARQVMETAETDARRLRHETEDFLDQRLGWFEILLDKLQKTVGAGRQRLSIGAVREQIATEIDDDEDDPTKGFFDQDG